MVKKYRGVYFDLDTKAMGEVLGSKTKGYRLIKKSMKELDFSHRQGSGYMSNIPLDKQEVRDFVKELGEKEPWLGKCVKVFDITNTDGKLFNFTTSLKDAASTVSKRVVKVDESTAKQTNAPGTYNASNPSPAFLDQMNGMAPRSASNAQSAAIKKTENINE